MEVLSSLQVPDLYSTLGGTVTSKYPPAKPGALVCEPLKAVMNGACRLLEILEGVNSYTKFNCSIR